MRKGEDDQSTKLIRCVVGVLLGGVVALLTCFLFLLLMSVGISKGYLGEGMMYQLTIVGCVLGGFTGGMTAVRRCGVRALVVGLLSGAVLFLILLTIGVIFYDSMTVEQGGLGLLCGSLCGGAAAGLLGGKRGNRKRSPAGKRHRR